jgi:hypothetical protein
MVYPCYNLYRLGTNLSCWDTPGTTFKKRLYPERILPALGSDSVQRVFGVESPRSTDVHLLALSIAPGRRPGRRIQRVSFGRSRPFVVAPAVDTSESSAAVHGAAVDTAADTSGALTPPALVVQTPLSPPRPSAALSESPSSSDRESGPGGGGPGGHAAAWLARPGPACATETAADRRSARARGLWPAEMRRRGPASGRVRVSLEATPTAVGA